MSAEGGQWKACKQQHYNVNFRGEQYWTKVSGHGGREQVRDIVLDCVVKKSLKNWDS